MCVLRQKIQIFCEDTDILCLLIHHNCDDYNDIFFDCKKGCFNVNSIKKNLPEKQSKHLLVCHAFTGCDTTSGLSGFGKAKPLETLCSGQVDEALDTFVDETSSKQDIKASGERLFKHIHGGTDDTTLPQLRFRKFSKQAKVGVIRPENLPPTENAAYQHSLRTFLQVQDWLKLTTMSLPPLEFGFKLVAGRHEPITTTEPIAPENLIKLICCNCSGDCDTLRCSCRKNGIVCVAACGKCHGVSCLNTECDRDGDE